MFVKTYCLYMQVCSTQCKIMRVYNLKMYIHQLKQLQPLLALSEKYSVACGNRGVSDSNVILQILQPVSCTMAQVYKNHNKLANDFDPDAFCYTYLCIYRCFKCSAKVANEERACQQRMNLPLENELASRERICE